MCILKDLSVKIKILLLAVIMLVITCIVAAVGIFSNHQSKQAADDMYNRNLMTTQYLNEATVQLRTMESDVNFLLLQDFTPENQKLLLDDLIAKAKTIQGDADKIKEIDTGERAQASIEKLNGNLSDFITSAESAKSLTTSQEDKAKLMKSLSGVKEISARLSELTPDNIQQGKLLFEQSNAVYERSIKIFLGIILAGLIIGVAAARIISKNIADPLEESVGLLNAVADGDLTQELPVELADRRDEVGEMVASLEKMQGALRAFLKDVHEEAERSVAMVHEVQELVGALNDGAQDMSAVTEEMAAGMEETAASTSNLENLSDQISASVKSNADEAEKSEAYTNEVAERASKLKQDMDASSKKAQDVYHQTKDSVEEAIEAAKVVDNITLLTKDITDIAEQTNLLALNASIEAARAGEHGRGFTVVAEEVGKLANESQHSAEKIARLIKNIQTDTDQAVASMQEGRAAVKEGAASVESLRTMFQSINEHVGSVSDQIEQISTAVEKVAHSAEIITHGVANIGTHSDNVSSHIQSVSAATEEQSASAEEIASASESLAKLAQDQQQALAHFQF